MLAELGLVPGRRRPVVAVFGGAESLSGDNHGRAVGFLGRGVVRAAQMTGADVVDGGTAAGVMAIVGEAVAEADMRPLLVGVAPAGLVSHPGAEADGERAALEPNHSHFVLASGAEWGAETPLLLRLAEALAEGSRVVAVLVGGGEVSKAEALGAVRRGWPLLVVEHSGGVAGRVAARRRALQAPAPRTRLGRWLPVRPRAAGAEPLARADDPDVDEIASADLVRLFDGGDAGALARELAWELQDERALKNAWRAFAGYDTLANGARATFTRFQAAILLLGVGGTFLALLDDAVGINRWPGDLVHWAVVAVPVLVSLLIALAWRFGFGKRWVLLRGAAEIVKSEIYRFRTATGAYADAALSGAGLSRDEALAARLNAIVETLIQTEASSWPLTPYDGPLPPKMYGASAEDDGLSPLDPERYLAFRVGDQLNYFHPKVARLARQLRGLQLLALAAGAAGTLLAAAGFEVWIGLTTAIAAAAVAQLGYLQVEPTLVSYNQAAGRLEALRRVWDAQPVAKRDFERLIADAEAVLATELSGWVQQMNQAIEEAARRAHARSSRDS